jgi:hypothetical protein
MVVSLRLATAVTMSEKQRVATFYVNLFPASQLSNAASHHALAAETPPIIKMSTSNPPFTVAIVGGGITGLALAIGLLRRNITFTIYERASSFRDIGAGIGFTPNAERAMRSLDPRIHAAFRKVAAQNAEDNFYYCDGFNWDEQDPEHEETMLKLYLGDRGFEGCRRPDFLEALVQHVPEECVEFGKDFVGVTDGGEGEKVVLEFKDGSSASADVGEYLPTYTKSHHLCISQILHIHIHDASC